MSLDDKLVEYVLEHGDELAFTEYFWKSCEPLEYDLSQYRKFVSAIKSAHLGVDVNTIAQEVGVSTATVQSWNRLEKMPKLGHFLKAFMSLGTTEEQKIWLNTETTHGHAIPIGRFLSLPVKISRWQEMDDVLGQLEPSSNSAAQFDKRYLFGFLLGMLIGDASKSRQKRFHRHIGLALSMKYETNIRLGDFTSLRAQSIGLRMHRVKDRARSRGKPHGFFEWASQSSPLIDWIFNVLLGLKDGEVTTYNPIRADWVFDSPREFRVGLVQGLAESDGSPNIANQSVEFWIGPNWEWMKRLLGSFGLRAFKSRQAVVIVKSQAVKSFGVPIFAEHLKTIRYSRLKILATTDRLRREDRLPNQVREEIVRLAADGLSVPKIVERIAETKGILVSFEAAQRWSRKVLRIPRKQERKQERNSIQDRQ